jgi:excisionase family DNA binding protein
MPHTAEPSNARLQKHELQAAAKLSAHSHYGFVGTPNRNFLTTKELAAELSVSIRQLERLRENGSGPTFIRVGKKHVRYLKVALDAWVEQQLLASMNNADASAIDAIPHH